MLVSFVLWTLLVSFVDVKAAGPLGSAVGFATMNTFVHSLTGVHMSLYNITDWLSLVPIGFVLGFAILGLVQWVTRKKLKHVDYSLFVLGGFYIAVMAAYIFFEIVVINYRPTLINGYLEASYPSSTTMLVMCVMPTAMMQLKNRIRSATLRKYVLMVIFAFTVFMVVGRLVSGVHWFSDIIGGTMLSTFFVMMYRYLIGLAKT